MINYLNKLIYGIIHGENIYYLVGIIGVIILTYYIPVIKPYNTKMRKYKLLMILTKINFNKKMYSTPKSIISLVGNEVDTDDLNELDDIGVKILRGFRGSSLINNLNKIPRELHLTIDEKQETSDTIVKIIHSNYIINLKEYMDRLETNLAIIMILLMFTPILGVMASILFNQPLINLLIILIQIAILETISRKLI